MRKIRVLLAAATFVAALAALPVSAASRCFPEQPTACIDGRLRAIWEQHGGLATFGYPLAEPEPQDGRTIQRFEHATIAVIADRAPPADIEIVPLGSTLLASRTSAPAAPDLPRIGCKYFAETSQNVCAPFLAAWRSRALDLGQPGVTDAERIALLGAPITRARRELLADGRTVTVQWFARARLEDHGAGGIQFAMLGREALPPPPPTLGNGAAAYPGGFLTVAGAQLTRLGEPVQLKGVNYYPQRRPWAQMWDSWDATQIATELRDGRDRLAINTIRILLPYAAETDGATGKTRIAADSLRQLREIVQIAGSLNVRVIVALFDFENEFPAADAPEQHSQIQYLESLIGNFAGDDRIIGWDLHNEPDHYPAWKDGRADQVLDWLGRTADVVHRLAPNHLVTVGMGQYENLWRAGPDGRSVLDISDIISLHNYNAPDTARQLAEIRARTPKPIILGEFGWPSGPRCDNPQYSEAQQAAAYQAALRQSDGVVAGVVAWALRDFDAGPMLRWDTREEFYGLIRPDGTLKPAALQFRAAAGAPLTALVQTSLPLTGGDLRLPGGGNAPIYPRGAAFRIKGAFRILYEQYGGAASFGQPLGDAFVRERDGTVVQYFTAAVIELARGTSVTTFDTAALPEVLPLVQRAARVVPHGADFAASRGVALDGKTYPVAPSLRAFYTRAAGEWRFGRALSPLQSGQPPDRELQVQYFERGRIEVDPRSGNISASAVGAWAQAAFCKED